ncbi:MAG: ferrous iron transport protein A [Bacilli bacterium]|nr:ferrous iron transport protein A [Bacilli bacterium]
MSLVELELNKASYLVNVDLPLKTKRHLESLGLVSGQEIEILSKDNRGLIIKIKESRLALDYGTASKLTVRKGE